MNIFATIPTDISTHAPLTRRDEALQHDQQTQHEFLLTRLLRGATPCPRQSRLFVDDFYSRASYEARLITVTKKSRTLHISTHAPLTRRDRISVQFAVFFRISTHAPLTRRDMTQYIAMHGNSISTHAPLTRRDLCDSLSTIST